MKTRNGNVLTFGPTEESDCRCIADETGGAPRIEFLCAGFFMFVLVALILVVAVVAAWNHWK